MRKWNIYFHVDFYSSGKNYTNALALLSSNLSIHPSAVNMFWPSPFLGSSIPLVLSISSNPAFVALSIWRKPTSSSSVITASFSTTATGYSAVSGEEGGASKLFLMSFSITLTLPWLSSGPRKLKEKKIFIMSWSLNRFIIFNYIFSIIIIIIKNSYF